MEKSVFKHFWGVGTNCHGNSLNGYVFKEIMLFSWKVWCIIQQALESYLWKACVQENQKYFINSNLWNIHADTLMFHTAIILPKGRSWITLPCICAFSSVLCGWTDLVYQPFSSASWALTQSLLPSIYKLLLTLMVVHSESKMFNPFHITFLFLTGNVSQNFLISNIGTVNVLKTVGWKKKKRIWAKNFPGKRNSYLIQLDGLRHLVTLKLIFWSQNWRIPILVEQVRV